MKFRYRRSFCSKIEEIPEVSDQHVRAPVILLFVEYKYENLIFSDYERGLIISLLRGEILKSFSVRHKTSPRQSHMEEGFESAILTTFTD